MSDELTQMERLQAYFRPEEHKTRSQGGKSLMYISIDATINRLNEVLGAKWNTRAKTDLRQQEGGYLALCEVVLEAEIDGKYTFRAGVGAMVNRDPDMAVKTALAEGIKKAGHALGIGLYLWDESERDSMDKRMRLSTASEAARKAEVFRLARERTGKDKPSAAEIAKVFGVKATDLSDIEVINSILKGEGLL